MPVEIVHVVHSHHIDQLLEIVDAEEVAPHIDHECTVAKTGCIGYTDGRQIHTFGRCHDGQRLHQALHAIKHTGMRAALDGHSAACHLDAVSLVALLHRPHGQPYLSASLTCGGLQADACQLLDITCEQLGIALLPLITLGIVHGHLAVYGKGSLGYRLHVAGQWHDMPVAHCLFTSCQTQTCHQGQHHHPCSLHLYVLLS